MTDNETIRRRAESAIREHAAPLMELDGTLIDVLDVDRGCLRVRLNGVCASCPSTIMTVIMGLEQEVRRVVPEVEYLEAVP